MSNQELPATDVFHSTTIIDPLIHNQDAIKTLLEIVKTCIGPFGKFKVIQSTSGGHITVTSSSLCLFFVVSTKSLIVKYILSSVKSHLSVFSNGGLYCCLLIVCMLQNSLNSSLSLDVVGDLIWSFGQLYTSLLTEHNNFLETIDLSNISQLQRVIHSILQSKPACLLSESDKSHLCLLLLKAFLSSIPNEIDGKMPIPINITYCTQTGNNPGKSQLLGGLTLKYPQLSKNEKILHKLKNCDILVILFSTSLAGDANLPSKQVEETEVSLWTEVFEHLMTICRKIISDGVQVVFCQKVIHPTLKKQLWDNDVLAIDRLGFEAANNVEKISGAVPVSSLSETCFTYGLLTRMDTVQIGKEKFLLLQNDKTPFWTISICNYNEQSVNETKIVCEQVLDTLYRLLKDPKVCCGAGCTEVYVNHLLKEKVMANLSELSNDYNYPRSTIQQSLNLFINSIYDVAFAINKGSRLTFVSERTFNHLWKLRDGTFPSQLDTCQCGKYCARSVPSHMWYFLDRTSSIVEVVTSSDNQVNVESELKPTVLDELRVKVNACTVAFEAASSLLNVGLCIFSEK